MITYVTAFLVQPTSKHSVLEYKTHFDRLVETEIRIVLFLDRQLSWSFPEHVHVIPVSMEDTWVGQYVPDAVDLPPVRSPTDTREYMMIQNAKTEFVWKASQLNPWKTQWFAWIDFGIGHVFRHQNTYHRIQSLLPPIIPGIHTAGIWNWTPNNLFHGVCWRYAGGFFLIHESRIQEFHEAVQSSILRNLPKIAWEVNTWVDTGLDLGWYQADHNDTIILFTQP